MVLYIIRHGKRGEGDQLAELGHRQAEALGRRLEKSGINRVFSSPNQRARQTAAPLCARLGLEAAVEPWMSEDANERLCHKDGGWLFSVPYEEAKSDETLAYGDRWYEAPPYADSVDGEGRWKEIMQHSDELTEKLGYRREGKVYRVIRKNEERVAAFCHAGTGRLWTSYLLGISPAVFWTNFAFTNSGVTILEFNGEEGTLTAPFCTSYSDMCHLYADGVGMRYYSDLYL